MARFVLVPLGRGYNHDYTDICPAAKARCRLALYKAWQLASTDRYHQQVTLLVSPGRETRRRTGSTMAELMGHYIDRLQPGLELVVNRTDPTVYGSLQEMQWAVHYMRQRYGSAHLMFVCARRQDLRLRIIARVWFPDLDITVIATEAPDDPPVPWWYEVVLAYPKLLAVWLGFGTVAEAFRRCVTWPIRG